MCNLVALWANVHHFHVEGIDRGTQNRTFLNGIEHGKEGKIVPSFQSFGNCPPPSISNGIH
jgi:hypothetical protein